MIEITEIQKKGKMKKLISTLVVAILLQSSVYCQLKNYNDDGKVKILTEKTILTIDGLNTKEKPVEPMFVGTAAAIGSILPSAAGYVMKVIGEKVKRNALAYKGEYLCSGSAENFYKSKNDTLLPKLTITRMIKTINKVDLVAAKIILIPELSKDRTAFRYYVDRDFKYDYSIAKTKGKYDYIDLTLEIGVKSISINKSEYKINDLRTTTISIPQILVGKAYSITNKHYSGWIPLPPKSILTVLKDVTTKEDKTVVKTNKTKETEETTEATTVIKHNAEDTKIITDNTGLYEVSIKAVETNPYKIKAENNQEFIESTGDSMNDMFKEIVKALTKEKEEE
jgi:hypothetical protein